MFNLKKVSLVVVGSLVATFFATANEMPPETGSKKNLSHLVSQYDTDKNGKLSKDEVRASKNSTLIVNFSKIDANNDGSLSKEELKSV
jgi:Ca2+-binding EF-hand superfamily protein